MRDNDATIIEADGQALWQWPDGTTFPVISGGSDDDAESETGDEGGSSDDESAEAPDDEGSGGDEGDDSGDSAEAFADLPAVSDLPAASEDQLNETYEALEERFQELDAGPISAEVIAEMTEIRDRQAAIREERERRNAEAEENKAKAEALRGAGADLPEPVRASAADIGRARRPQRAADQTASDSPQGDSQRPVLAMAAGPGAEGVQEPGEDISFGEIGRAVQRRKAGQWTGKVVLASIAAYEDHLPTADLLHANNSLDRNTELIHESVEEFKWRRRGRPEEQRPAVLAAICDPLEPIREIPECSVADSPVASAFPSRGMGRGGFVFLPSIGIEALSGGVDEWTSVEEAAVDPDDSSTWKACIHIDCPTPETVSARAVSACFTFDNSTEMSNPERIRNVISQITAARTRVKEARLLALIDALSTNSGAFTSVNGTLPTIVEWLNTVLVQAAFGPRLDESDYTLFIDPWLVAAVGIDLGHRAFAPSYQGGLAALTEVTNDLGIEVVVPREVAAPFADPFADLTAGPALPDTGRVRLVVPTDGIYADTGEQHTGIERDTSMLRQNRAQWFSDEWFLLAKHGCAEWVYGDLEICANGARTGWNDPEPCELSA